MGIHKGHANPLWAIHRQSPENTQTAPSGGGGGVLIVLACHTQGYTGLDSCSSVPGKHSSRPEQRTVAAHNLA